MMTMMSHGNIIGLNTKKCIATHASSTVAVYSSVLVMKLFKSSGRLFNYYSEAGA